MEEYDKLKELCLAKGVNAIVNTSFVNGSEGAIELAHKVVEEINKGETNYKPLYKKSDSIEHKIKTIATEIYGADGVEYSTKSRTQLKMINDLGFNEFSICMAKTQASFSDNEKLIGRPTNFAITIREFEIASGARFIVPLLGEVMRMPGLPIVPNAERIDIDNDGKIIGLS
jgi:formate--tetrahydrofolate ligase